MTIFHMKQSIAGCLRNNCVGTIDFLEDGNGKPLSDAEARIELNKLLEAGHTVMPVGDDCEGFDVFGGGCPGHEPLAGSELVRAMLERGDKIVTCLISNESDDEAIKGGLVHAAIVTDIGARKGRFITISQNFWSYAVAINNMGEILTAKEVGL